MRTKGVIVNTLVRVLAIEVVYATTYALGYAIASIPNKRRKHAHAKSN